MFGLDTDLKRSTRNRRLLGVCGGIAHKYGWPASRVRLVTAIVAIAIPGPSLVLSLAVYFALGLMLPESDEY